MPYSNVIGKLLIWDQEASHQIATQIAGETFLRSFPPSFPPPWEATDYQVTLRSGLEIMSFKASPE